MRGTCDSGGGSVKKMGPVGPLSRYWHGRPPLPFGERGTCDSGGGSVHLTFCTSLSAASPVNVPGGSPPPPWLPRLPAKKIAASRNIRPIPGAHPYGASASAVQNCSRQFSLRLIPSGFRVGHQPASLQAMPSRRIHAPRPGLQETLRRFSAGPAPSSLSVA